MFIWLQSAILHTAPLKKGVQRITSLKILILGDLVTPMVNGGKIMCVLYNESKSSA